MSSLGAYLKEMRNKCHLSLKDVQEQCGVTDSKLSRLERGEGKTLAPYELKSWRSFMESALFRFTLWQAIWIKATCQRISLFLTMLIF